MSILSRRFTSYVFVIHILRCLNRTSSFFPPNTFPKPYFARQVHLKVSNDGNLISGDRGDKLNLNGHFSRRQFIWNSVAAGSTVFLAPSIARSENGLKMEDRLVWSVKKEFTKGRKNITYSKLFITYLTRFLINYDVGTCQYWESMIRKIPLSFTKEQVKAERLNQFAALAESVEVGLQDTDFQGKAGAINLFSLILSRYGDTEEQKRQIAILFCLGLSNDQPTERLAELLARIDGAGVSVITVTDAGYGYSADTPPEVHVQAPYIGNNSATARAILQTTGRIRGIQIVSRGCGYRTAPKVSIAPPDHPGGIRATAEAILNKDGSIADVIVTNPGRGYTNFKVGVTVEVPEDNSMCGILAQCKALVDYQVSQVVVSNPGSGYALSMPLTVTIQSPAETGSSFQGRGGSAIATAERLKKPNQPTKAVPKSANKLPTSVSAQLEELLDTNVYFPSWNPADNCFFLSGLTGLEALINKDTRAIKNEQYFDLAFSNPQFFGPVGRNPIERDLALGPEGFLRLGIAGALCTAFTRAVLHPIDLVKCRMQRYPNECPNMIAGFQRSKEQGLLLRGADVTVFNGLLIGFSSFGLVEFFRRTLTVLAEDLGAPGYTVFIILFASSFSQVFADFLVVPFESIRIQIVTSPADASKSTLAFAKEAVDTNGIRQLFNGYFPLLVRDIPFTISKFLVYDLVQKFMFNAFPVTEEDPALTLAVSLLAGLVAGVTGAIVTTPPDNILTKVSFRSTDQSTSSDWKQIVKELLQEQEGGIANLFRGVGLRSFYFGSLISLQFFLYDFFKILFHVSSDDLKVVLDVFSDRLSFYADLYK